MATLAGAGSEAADSLHYLGPLIVSDDSQPTKNTIDVYDSGSAALKQPVLVSGPLAQGARLESRNAVCASERYELPLLAATLARSETSS